MSTHNNEQSDMQSEYVQQPPFKRQRNSDPSDTVESVNSRLPPLNLPTNKGANNVFYKTRMCAKFRLGGTCRNGENCNFAHGTEDIRQPPSNWQELVGLGGEEERPSANWDEDQRIIQRMRICKNYYYGKECPYGERCSFLHEDPAKFREDYVRMRDNLAISIPTNTSQMTYPSGLNNNNGIDMKFENDKSVNSTCYMNRVTVKPSTSWKTKLCVKCDTRPCPCGERFHFAHGPEDLQYPDGRVEAEAKGAIAVSKLANDASIANARRLIAPNKEKQSMKCLLKWKGPRKINRIYADWLDDMSLVHNLQHGKVES